MNSAFAFSFWEWSSEHSSQLGLWLAILTSLSVFLVLVDAFEKWKDFKTVQEKSKKALEVTTLLLLSLIGFWSWKASDMASTNMDAKVDQFFKKAASFNPRKRPVESVFAIARITTEEGKIEPNTYSANLSIGKRALTSRDTWKIHLSSDNIKFEEFDGKRIFQMYFPLDSLSSDSNVEGIEAYDALMVDGLPWGCKVLDGSVIVILNGAIRKTFQSSEAVISW